MSIDPHSPEIVALINEAVAHNSVGLASHLKANFRQILDEALGWMDEAVQGKLDAAKAARVRSMLTRRLDES